MTTKLAIRHKDSLALKESGPPRGNNSTIRKRGRLRGCCGALSVPWTTLGVFLAYWFILCPLIWAVCHAFAPWPPYGPWLFWAIAFLIWATIMCGLMIFWRHSQAEESREISAVPRYGSDSARRPLSIQRISFDDIRSLETEKKRNDFLAAESKELRENLKKDLPPLVIHRQISGEDIEDTAGVVRVEEDEGARLNAAGDRAERSPLQDYLKLVTVSPTEDEVRSPKTPMSPRELFFIDLIRQAERAESAAKSPRAKARFFPNEAIGDEDAGNARDPGYGNGAEGHAGSVGGLENARDEGDRKASKSRPESESSYFIADVESPVSEKTEVFLRIDSNVGEGKAESIVGKPTLMLLSNEANAQETSTSPS